MPGKHPGSSIIRLNGKKALVLVRKNVLPDRELRQLKKALAAGKKPSVQGTADFYGYPSGAIQLIDAHTLRFQERYSVLSCLFMASLTKKL